MSHPLTLCYHALSHSWPAPLAVKPKAFEQQLEQLLARGYEPATFSAVARGEATGRPLVVTFDDAFRSVLELAAPIMARLGVPGTVFVATAYPDSGKPMAWEGLDTWMGGPHGHELACLGWDELRGLRDGGWEIGAHSHTHPYLTRLPNDDLLAELQAARAVLEDELGEPCTALAYPYGDTDDRVIAAAGRAGYLHAGALDARLRRSNPLRVPRVGVYRHDDGRRFDLKTSRSIRAVRCSPAWHAVTAGRRGVASGRDRLAATAGVNAEVPVALAIDLANLV
jgi:peptidoglycan/xylan/chitin deacetylase (PgdA/CDA1 family)